MELESKQVGVEAKAIDDAEGTVQAVVSVTNIIDNVKDVIEPGAYEQTLGKRIPKGVWSHDTTIPIAKTLSAIELSPGDERLPNHLREQDAGGVLVKMKFNLNTTRGREAYEDIKFFGQEQEWSIGYSVPEGGSEMKGEEGIRHIKQLEWYEYSPVLFGAAPGTRTVSVKEDTFSEETTEEGFEDSKGPIRSHAVGFADDRPWKPAMYKNVRSPADKAYYSNIFAFHKTGEDPNYKTNYSYIHHYVNSEGKAGAASLGGLREGVGSLNGSRRGTTLRGNDRKGVYNHLARHYREGGENNPPELKSDQFVDEIMQLKETYSDFDFAEIDALIEKGAEIVEIKSSLEDIMADEAEITLETAETEASANSTAQSVIQDAIATLNTLSEQLDQLEEKAGDTAGFSNTAPESSERAEGAGEDAPEVVENLSHGGTNTPSEMEVEGTPAGNSEKPAKKPAAKKPADEPAEEEAEKADESITEETVDEVIEDAKSVLDSIDLAELREFQDLVTYSDLGE